MSVLIYSLWRMGVDEQTVLPEVLQEECGRAEIETVSQLPVSNQFHVWDTSLTVGPVKRFHAKACIVRDFKWRKMSLEHCLGVSTKIFSLKTKLLL